MKRSLKWDLGLLPSSRSLSGQETLDSLIAIEKRVIYISWMAAGMVLLLLPALAVGDRLRPILTVIAFAVLHRALYYFVVIPFRPQWLRNGMLMTFGDVVLVTLAVWATGGLQSTLYLGYFFISVLSAIRFSGQSGLSATMMATVAYTLAVFWAGAPVTGRIVGEIALRMGFVAITGVFVGYVADRAKDAERALAEELDKAHQALAEAGEVLSRSLEFREVTRVVVEQALTLLGGDWSLLVVQTEGGEESYVASTGRGRGLSRLVDHSLLRLTGSGEGVVVRSGQEARRLLGLEGLEVEVAFLAQIPLYSGSTCMGELAVARFGAAVELRETQKNLLAAFAARAAIALTNARSFDQARQLAVTDSATGLANHRRFIDRLKEELRRSQETARPLAMLMLDVDNFKAFNDTFGHTSGDDALRDAAQAISAGLGSSDLAARYGGDEFVLLLPNSDRQGAIAVAERIRRRFRAHFAGRPQTFSVPLTLSIGVAAFPDDAVDRNGLINAADLAMYLAKQSGGNQVRSAEEIEASSLQNLFGRIMAQISGGPGRRAGLASELERHLEQVSQLVKEAGQPGRSRGKPVEQLSLETITALAATIDAKDPYTRHHSQNVSNYAARFARALGLDPKVREEVRVAALMHDVGKIGIADAILTKNGPLSPEEWAVMRQHPSIGARILSSVRSLRTLTPAIRHHHERWDGSGYPDGLRGEQIPLSARILAICDAFEAMTSDRPYRQALDRQRALQVIVHGRETQFDPRLADVFVRMVMESQSLDAAEAEAAAGGQTTA